MQMRDGRQQESSMVVDVLSANGSPRLGSGVDLEGSGRGDWLRNSSSLDVHPPATQQIITVMTAVSRVSSGSWN